MTLTVRKVDLRIVVPNEFAVRLPHLVQRGSFIEVVIRETPHDPKMRLYVILPALPWVNAETSPGESLHISDLSIRLKILLRHPKGLKSRQDIRNQVR
jgi:hypothetical protein